MLVAGVDEAGRGPLAGPVVAAAVILPSNHNLVLSDSKKISAKKREQLYLDIKAHALAWSIALASASEIDEINILQASLLAMKRAVSELKIKPDMVMVDGNCTPKINLPCQAIVKGDSKIASISAASILAKVYRDELMLKLHQQNPEYGFAAHKGYPTKQHLQALASFGILSQHRKSFGPVAKLLEPAV